ncbi:hypothetical protein BRD56_00555 [Thermoplasmatales archaeon SW_10_69_26]|nr:MAG: hypothetical protein BRD56_00555 [Thermoplasmatales archaeon SW_10_69_26]
MAPGGNPVSSVSELTDAQQRVIERLYEGKYAAAIADEVNVTRQAVSKHVRKLEEKGLITEHAGETAFYRRSLGQGTSFKIYGLTDAGLQALREAQGLGPGETPRTPSTGLTEPPPGQYEDVNEPAVHNAPAERGPRVEVHNYRSQDPDRGRPSQALATQRSRAQQLDPPLGRERPRRLPRSHHPTPAARRRRGPLGRDRRGAGAPEARQSDRAARGRLRARVGRARVPLHLRARQGQGRCHRPPAGRRPRPRRRGAGDDRRHARARHDPRDRRPGGRRPRRGSQHRRARPRTPTSCAARRRSCRCSRPRAQSRRCPRSSSAARSRSGSARRACRRRCSWSRRCAARWGRCACSVQADVGAQADGNIPKPVCIPGGHAELGFTWTAG